MRVKLTSPVNKMNLNAILFHSFRRQILIRSTGLHLRHDPTAFRDEQIGDQIRADQIISSGRAHRLLGDIVLCDFYFAGDGVDIGVGRSDADTFRIEIKSAHRLVAELRRRDREDSGTRADV